MPWKLRTGQRDGKDTVGKKLAVQLGDKQFEADGKQLICRDMKTGELCFAKTFDHPDYESLRDLNIREISPLPGGKDLVVLFEMAHRGYKTVGNLIRITALGDLVWWAELTDTGSDAYTAIAVSDEGIQAFSWDGYSCKIDPTTGRILSKTFAK